VLAGDKLIVPMENDGESFLAAVDTKTGRNVWKASRPISLSTLGTAETGDGRSELTNPTPAPTPAPVPPTTPPVVQPEPVSVPRPLSAVAPPAGSPLPVWAFAAFAAAVLFGLLAAYLL
jgi:hypothetical protein